MSARLCCALATLLCAGVALSVHPAATRNRRQIDNRNQIINDIFQIPIQTLTAVSTLVQRTRPVFPNRFHRDSVIPNVFTRPTFSPTPAVNPARGPLSVGAAAVQVKPAADGSSFKI